MTQTSSGRPLRIVVCVKPVPDPAHWDQITLDPQTHTLRRDGIASVINPLDKNALEEGLRLKEAVGGKVTVLSMAPPSATETLYGALAMGADEAVLLSDRALGGADTLATSNTIVAGIAKLGGADIVLFGNRSLDGSTGHVAAQVAELLDAAQVTSAISVEPPKDGRIRVTSKMDFGQLAIEARLPVVIAVRAEINTPRFTSLLGIIEARSKQIVVWNAKDLAVDPARVGVAGSPTQVAGVFVPSVARRGELLEGDPEWVSQDLVERLRRLGVSSLK